MNQEMNLIKGIPVNFGTISGTVFGGPFRKFVPGTRRLVGIKMAKEISHPHDFKVDTEDFSVPTQEDMQLGIKFALEQLVKGNDIYAGCMGGIGRTGLFMACMASVMIDYSKCAGDPPPVPGASVAYVRAHYLGHAVETEEQQKFVADFDTEPSVDWLMLFNNPEPKVEVQVVEKIVYLGPLSWALHSFGNMFQPRP